MLRTSDPLQGWGCTCSDRPEIWSRKPEGKQSCLEIPIFRSLTGSHKWWKYIILVLGVLDPNRADGTNSKLAGAQGTGHSQHINKHTLCTWLITGCDRQDKTTWSWLRKYSWRKWLLSDIFKVGEEIWFRRKKGRGESWKGRRQCRRGRLRSRFAGQQGSHAWGPVKRWQQLGAGEGRQLIGRDPWSPWLGVLI